MRYMMLIYSKESAGGLEPDQRANLINTHKILIEESRQKGVLVGYDALKPTTSATTVRVNGGAPIITDGPFAETREVLGVHIIGDGASELIHIGQAVMAHGGTVDYFVNTVFNYPTLAECYKTAAFDGINRLN